jgi:hypothetical protein
MHSAPLNAEAAVNDHHKLYRLEPMLESSPIIKILRARM